MTVGSWLGQSLFWWQQATTNLLSLIPPFLTNPVHRWAAGRFLPLHGLPVRVHGTTAPPGGAPCAAPGRCYGTCVETVPAAWCIEMGFEVRVVSLDGYDGRFRNKHQVLLPSVVCRTCA